MNMSEQHLITILLHKIIGGTTLSIIALSIIALSIIALSIIAPSIKWSFSTLSTDDIEHKQH